MPVMNGYIGDEKVSVLRNSGCNSAILKKSLVNPEQLRGCEQRCILADGTVRTFPVADVEVDTPYYTENVDVLCIENPVYDLVLGNIKSVRSADNPDEKWRPPRRSKSRQNSEILSVGTRAQRHRREKENPLHVTDRVREFSKVEITEGQLHDASLEKCKLKAESGEVISTNMGTKSWHVKENELIYRFYQNIRKDTRIFKQLIVPKGQQTTAVLKLAHETILSGHLGVRKTKEVIL